MTKEEVIKNLDRMERDGTVAFILIIPINPKLLDKCSLSDEELFHKVSAKAERELKECLKL